MLKRLHIDGIDLPRLYIARCQKDIDQAIEQGIPYIVWQRSEEDLIKIILRPILEKIFPYIDWDRVLGKKRRFKTQIMMVDPEKRMSASLDRTIEKSFEESSEESAPLFDMSSVTKDGEHTEIADIANDVRTFDCQGKKNNVKMLSLEEYVSDVSSNINIEVIQKLGMLPSFIGNIVDCIKTNMSNAMRWNEGYTKKLGVPLGNFQSHYGLKNLIILDVSGSIPRGISATMISLIETLRNQCHADLIITAGCSRFYPYGSDLPDPQDIRDLFGYMNESYEFFDILENHIFGHEYGHVISFGDNDAPNYEILHKRKASNTKVHEVHHYHTIWNNTETGYARWVDMICTPDVTHYDRSWCNVINR